MYAERYVMFQYIILTWDITMLYNINRDMEYEREKV